MQGDVVRSKLPSAEQEFDPKVVAQQIDKIERAFSRIQKGGLNRRAIVALIHDQTKLGKRSIEEVLDALLSLRKRYLSFGPTKRIRKP